MSEEPLAVSVILSLFPGIDMLGRGFEAEGYCVVRGPDLLWGSDIRSFNAAPAKFSGVIAGSPCQDFSKLNRQPGEYGQEMLGEFRRVVLQARPQWWLLENVPTVPDIMIEGYGWQRLDLRASEFGLKQRRLRHFQFGHRDQALLILDRKVTALASESCCLATEGKRSSRRSFSDFCMLQGLPPDFDLPGLSIAAKYRAVGNGVPIPMSRALARAIYDLRPSGSVRVCECGCGRPLHGKKKSATASCRKRLQRRRDRAARVTPRAVTSAGESQHRDRTSRVTYLASHTSGPSHNNLMTGFAGCAWR